MEDQPINTGVARMDLQIGGVVFAGISGHDSR